MTALLFSLQSVGVRFGPVQALSGCSLRVNAGDRLALVGSNGSGKSTLLRTLHGLVEPASGSLQRDAGARQAMVFQRPHLLRASVLHNVALGLWLQGVERPAARARALAALERVGLAELAGRPARTLSGGQQQRVALARALAPNPRLLLLDEPFSNLDVDLRERLAHEVRAILKAAGATALFVTHDQLEAFAIGDVIGVMHEGHLHQWDDAYALYHRPATRFVAEFIGHGVFAPAQIRLVGNEVSVQTPLGALQDMDECPLPTAYEAGLCDVLLRADDIVHDDHAPVKAQIIRKAFRGSEFLYTLRLASGETLMTHVPSHHNHALGEWIGIRAEVDHVVTFARGGAAMSPPAPSAVRADPHIAAT